MAKFSKLFVFRQKWVSYKKPNTFFFIISIYFCDTPILTNLQKEKVWVKILKVRLFHWFSNLYIKQNSFNAQETKHINPRMGGGGLHPAPPIFTPQNGRPLYFLFPAWSLTPDRKGATSSGTDPPFIINQI